MPYTITRESPLVTDLELLMQRHTAAMHADSPPESIHMMDASALAMPGIDFFVLRNAGTAIGMGAIKKIDPHHAEIKSMHILSEHRGAGHSVRILDHLIAAARETGFERLSLETGAQPSFAAARGLYLKAGFQICGPFTGYREDPNSTFMTLVL